jgi:hypothetical protein
VSCWAEFTGQIPVVGQDPFNGDATLSEPRDGTLQHTDRGGCFLVGADPGIGHAGVIIDDDVHEGYSDVGR